MTTILRPAIPEDALDVARVHVRAWQIGYAGLMPDEYLRSLDPTVWATRYRFDDPDRVMTVAVEDDAIVGLTIVETDGDLCEIRALYVDPPRWGSGIGGLLLDAATDQLRDNGFATGELWALRGNERAARFYRKHGWASDGRVRTELGRGGVVHTDDCYVLSLGE